MKIINKLLITLIAITFIFNFMILDNYNIYAEKINTYEVDPYTQESIEYINELKENGLQKSINNQMYNDIYQAMINLEDSVDLSSYGPPSSTEVFNIRKKVLDDHPEIFYFKHEGSVYWSNGELEFKYIDSKSVIRNMISELDIKVDIILKKYIDKSMSQMEKLIAIHDYIVLNTTYLKTTYCYDPYGVIVKGRGVCQGYAESMKLLLNKIGIECIYVSSPDMNHGWNIVNIDGENYHLDATWNDPIPNRDGAVRYKYLALSDYEMSKDHYWDREQYPTCNSDKYKYMREMDYVVNGINYRYYSQTEGNWHIYKINKDGTNKEKIVNEAATPLYIKDGYLYYKEYFSGITKKILIDEETVTNPVKVTDIKLNKTSLTLLEGESETLEAMINPSDATDKTVTWESSNSSVATVDETGNVTAVSAGTATITVKTKDGSKEATCKLTVKKPVTSVTENKLIGEDRYKTAIKVSNEGWSKSENIVLVNSSAIVDALSATPFAKMKNAPILLTEKDKLNSETRKEIIRLGAKNVYVIGGSGVVSENVISQLKAMNLNIDRISGDDRYSTSLEIAKRLGDVSEIAVVNGVTGLADAVSIAPVAADRNMPIVLSSPNEGTKIFDEFIKSNNIETSYVIGGETSISKDVASKLPNANRLGGLSRNETNAIILGKFYTHKDLNNIFVAKNGMKKVDDLIDALAVGVLAAKENSPLVIVGDKLDIKQEEVLKSKTPKAVTQVGGNGNENAFSQIVNMFKK